MAPQNCVMILDLPKDSLFGFDLVSLTPSQKFHGVKQIPTGWHFLFVSSTSALSIRNGHWFYVTDKDEIASIWKWDSITENLTLETSSDYRAQMQGQLPSLWEGYLMPYSPMTSAASGSNRAEQPASGRQSDWAQLTSCIAASLFDRIFQGDTFQSDHSFWRQLSSASADERDVEHIPGLSSKEAQDAQLEEQQLAMLPIELKQTWRPGAVGRERTEAAQDKSWALGEVLNSVQATTAREQEDSLLGEMQLTFLMVLTLANYSCLEQWKRIIGLLLTCRTAVKERPSLFDRLLQILLLQLKHCEDVEGELFDLTGGNGAFLKQHLRGFKRTLSYLAQSQDELTSSTTDVVHHNSTTMFSSVKETFESLEQFLRSEHNWDLSDSYVRRGMLELEDGEQVEMEVSDLEGEDERGEYAPVIVGVEEEHESIER